MRASALLALGALGVAFANPIATPQDTSELLAAYEDSADDIEEPQTAPADAVAAVVIPIDPSPVISAAVADATSGGLQKRGTCQANPPGGGPTVNSPADDADSFLAYQPFHDAAQAATAASAPAGYHQVFQDIDSSITAGSYMGYNGDYTTYDVQGCAAQCTKTKGCVSFNMFYERNAVINADDTNCPNPASLTRIKCSFWGVPVTENDATNHGQYQSQFHVVITGSNAYTNAPLAPAGFNPPVYLNAATIITPKGDDSYMGMQTFPNAAYSPQACADACNAKSAYNTRHAASGTSPRICRFFDAYMLYKNGANGLFTCAYYTAAWSPSYATNKGYTNGANGDVYTIGNSYSFTLASS